MLYSAWCREAQVDILKNERYSHITQSCLSSTGWPRPIACLKLHVIFRTRATNYRALLREMTYENKAPYGSSPPCREAQVDIVKNQRYSHMRLSWLSSREAQVHLSQESALQWHEKQRYSDMIQSWLCKREAQVHLSQESAVQSHEKQRYSDMRMRGIVTWYSHDYPVRRHRYM